MKTLLTGDRPTGSLHLGHYVGSLKNRVLLQEKYETYIMIANVQALTDYYENPHFLNENIYKVLKDYLSCGISPNFSNIFVQSKISGLFEMSMYFMNLVSLARLQRNPTIKEELKTKAFKDNVNCGFMCYPISQAADILGFEADLVPVGKDQLPMIEQANEIAEKFNTIYKCNVLKKAEALIGQGEKLLGIDGKAKASKSLNNAIFLTDTNEELKQKVMAMYTDPGHIKITDPGKVEGNIVFHYLKIFYENKDHLNQLQSDYEKGGLGDIYLKNLLFNILKEFLEPIRERRLKINEADLKEILENGNKKANEKVNKILEKMRLNMFL